MTVRSWRHDMPKNLRDHFQVGLSRFIGTTGYAKSVFRSVARSAAPNPTGLFQSPPPGDSRHPQVSQHVINPGNKSACRLQKHI
jgi:hypothetical protein